jgi:hypothetical protein
MREKRGISGRRFPAGLFLVLLAFSTGSAAALSPFDLPGNVQCDFWQTSDGLPNHDVETIGSCLDIRHCSLLYSLVSKAVARMEQRMQRDRYLCDQAESWKLIGLMSRREPHAPD